MSPTPESRRVASSLENPLMSVARTVKSASPAVSPSAVAVPSIAAMLFRPTP